MANIERASCPEDPERCQGVISTRGQCINKRVEDSEYCIIHAGLGPDNKRKERISNYRLAKWQARLEKQAANPNVKNLRDEVGILRIVMEETLNKCENNFDLISNSQRIGDLVMKITTVVEKCHRLEGSMGMLLDKTTVLSIANTFISIIVEESLPEETLDRIASKILTAVGQIGGEEETD